MKENITAILSFSALIFLILSILMYLTTFTPELWYQFKFYILRYKFKGQRRIKQPLRKCNEMG